MEVGFLAPVGFSSRVVKSEVKDEEADLMIK